MQTSELRLVLAAVYAAPTQAFAQELHAHVWGQLYGGFHSPATLSNFDMSSAWQFSASLEKTDEGVKATITVEARYETGDARELIAALQNELPARLHRDLTVRGNTPLKASVEEIHEHPYNATAPGALMAA